MTERSTVTGTVLDPDLAARISSLRLRTKHIVDGLLGGAHRSPHRGASVVFVEHRDYRPGDDVRLIDWRAFARTDRHVIKRFEQETQLRAHLVLDQSASMGYRSDSANESKQEYAAALLAALAYILVGQGDAVGMLTIDEDVERVLPPRSHPAHLEALFRLLAQAGRSHHTDLRTSIISVAETVGRRGIIVLASDLLDLEAEALRPLAQLTTRGHAVLIFHVLDPRELHLDIRGSARVEGLEGEASLEADLDAIRVAYQEELEAFLESCRQQCLSAGARYVLAPTSEAPELVLARAIAAAGTDSW